MKIAFNKQLAFDIGANIGNITAKLLTQYNKVICFEPQPKLKKHLEERFKNKNVEIVEIAVSNNTSTKTFYISEIWDGVLSTLAENWKNQSRFNNIGNWREQIIVQTTTLDSIIEQYGIPDFIKIDVEGHEYEVFCGLTKLLDNTLFGFEWTEELFVDAENIVKHVQGLGYNNFSYTYEDVHSNIDNLTFKEWSALDLHTNINSSRKTLWGMIYFKK